MPESNKIWGELKAPPETIVSFAKIFDVFPDFLILPLFEISTPTHF